MSKSPLDPDTPMTWRHVNALIDHLRMREAAVLEAMRRSNDYHEDRLARYAFALRDAFAPQPKVGLRSLTGTGTVYRGVHQRSDDYQRGNFVTHKGSIWHCNSATRDVPGESSAWTLAAKAKDIRP